MKPGSLLLENVHIPITFYLEHIGEENKNDYFGNLALRDGDMSPELAVYFDKNSKVVLADNDGLLWVASIRKLRPDGFTFNARPLRNSTSALDAQ